MDTTTEFLFGESVNSLKQGKHGAPSEFAESFNIAQDFIAKRMRLQDLYWLIGGKDFRRACDTVHRFADRIIEKSLSRDRTMDKNSQKYAFLDCLADTCKDREELRSQIVNILVAGRDTTACLLSWTFFLLLRHQNELEKLRSEISSTLGARTDFSRTDLKNMTFLQNVLKEVLRLYPSVPVNTRTARKDTMLPVGGGPDLQSPVFIPKGAAVAYSVYSMHRRPDFYGMDAELFRPDRWSENLPLYEDPINARWGYLPFNGGPRICIGMDFALTEAAFIVVRLLQTYPSITLPASEKVELVGVEKQTMTLVVSSTHGCRADLSL